MFVLVQLALQPDNRAADNGSIATAWWVATGVYSFFTLSWFLGVVLLHDYVLCFQRVFSEANAYILSIYLSSTAYTLCSLKSYSHYSFLHRIRWSATSTDFFIETCWYYSQNWPTIITLIPRAIICIIVLVLYNPSGTLSSTLSSTPGLMSARDPFFFDSATDLLSTYASIVLVVYLGWVSWRALVLVVSYFGLLFTMGFSGLRHAKLNVILPQNVVNFGSSRRFSSSVPLTRPSDVTSWLDKEPGSEMMIHFTHADGQPIFMQRAEDRIRELLFEYAPHRFSAAADQGFSRSFGRSMEQARPRSYAEELPMGSYQSSRPGPHGPASGSKFYQATIGLGTVDEGSKSKHNVPADDSADRAPSEEERRIPSHATPMFSMGRPVAAAEKLSSDNARPVGEREGGKGPPNLVPFPFLSLRNNDVGSPIRISNDGSLPRSSISRDGALPMPSAFNDVVPAVPRALCRRESASSSLSTASTTRGTSSSIYYQPEEMMLQPSQSDEHIEDRTAETQSPLSPTGQREESTDPITPHRSWPILHQKLDFVSRKPEASTWWAFLPGLRANPASRVDKSQLQKTETMHSQTDQTDAERPNSIEIVFTGEESATDPSVQPAAPAQEHHDVPVVPPSPSQTMETSESDDSAELRLWQSFPEQSRINPPGLVALRLEQHSFEEAEWKKDKAREMDAERAVAQLQNLAAAITPKLAATSSQDLSKSPSEGGLIPIKEESWGSSLNSAIASHDGHERPGEEVSVSIPQNIDIPM
ncbi:hypothetical protein K437DRAFT_138993 [Tilletiaria anomala UBC 951]|uniref:Uncharacterized protein n=1 Tax=Tilletiaria anomala (strain ATCC 24038 / CBS 436.72 / UBC 951) TaxID=1037660 RepID=A0A066VVU5_TILAU|nr:uncharacterized protein K437DRAFT_138993 [Tilletiaria anomala UBC 951]KDN44383.1 hypothetical protein K437DRAFT_138993 [Tilletiaria anomala UBC 951]